MENLLCAVMEALTEPTVSYIGLGYDTSISLSAGECGNRVMVM